jgi:hypothetical protein
LLLPYQPIPQALPFHVGHRVPEESRCFSRVEYG